MDDYNNSSPLPPPPNKTPPPANNEVIQQQQPPGQKRGGDNGDQGQEPPPPHPPPPPGGTNNHDGYGKKGPPSMDDDSAILKSFAILPKISGSLSFLGSSFIIYDVLTKRLCLFQQRNNNNNNNNSSRSRNASSDSAPNPTITNRRRFQRSQQQQQSPKNTTYYRLLLGMSIFDVLASVAYIMSTWPIPSTTPHTYHNIGTISTCTAQGFFTQLGLIGTILYSGSLSTYYLLTIRYGWKQFQITNSYVEYWLHGIPVIFAITTSIIGIIKDIYNPTPIGCFINKVPPFCVESWENKEGPECIRGDNATIYKWMFSLIPKVMSVTLVSINMFLCYRHVLKLEKATIKFRNPESRFITSTAMSGNNNDSTTIIKRKYSGEYDFGGGERSNNLSSSLHISQPAQEVRQQQQQQQQETSGGNGDDDDNDDPLSPSLRSRESRDSNESFSWSKRILFSSRIIPSRIRRRNSSTVAAEDNYERSRKMANQCYLYVGALYLTLLPEFLMRIAYLTTNTRPHGILIAIACLNPLQGFWNALIYIRPRYLKSRGERRRQKKKKKISIRSTRQVLLMMNAPSSASSSNNGSSSNTSNNKPAPAPASLLKQKETLEEMLDDEDRQQNNHEEEEDTSSNYGNNSNNNNGDNNNNNTKSSSCDCDESSSSSSNNTDSNNNDDEVQVVLVGDDDSILVEQQKEYALATSGSNIDKTEPVIGG